MAEISKGTAKHTPQFIYDKDNENYFTNSYRPETWTAGRELIGKSIILLPTVPSGFAHEVTDGGITGATEPVWATKNGLKTTDNTVEYKAIPADSLLGVSDVISTSEWRFSDNDDWEPDGILPENSRISPSVPNGFEYDCPLGGTLDDAEPIVYPTVEGEKVVNGSCELFAVYVGDYDNDIIIDGKATKVRVTGVKKGAEVLNLRNIVTVTRANGDSELYNRTLSIKIKEL